MVTASARRLDLNFLGTALLIAGIGCMLVFSATHFTSDARLFQKQLLWTAIGIGLMVLCMWIDYHALLEMSSFLYVAGLALLMYLLLWGRLTRNVRSWIHVGSFQFQPSEFVKIFTALAIAKFFDSNDRAYLTFKNFVLAAVIILLPAFLIAIQPAFGSAATFMPLLIVAMFFGGIKRRYWIAMALLVVIAAPVGWHFLKPFQKERVVIFLNPDRDPLGSGYQLTQAKIATGSGGIRGKGFLHGTQVNLQYLPASHTDFIFSVLGEEWGFVGVSIVLTLYLYLIIQALLIAAKSRDRGGAFLVLGLISFFVFHIVINVSMQIGLLPVTGIPLPLLSYGGSATMMFLMAIGLILNVDMRRFVNA
ncbi:MAG TPA: rod shape-determining protein RodA [Thermoanaerobaculia bacterium]